MGLDISKRCDVSVLVAGLDMNISQFLKSLGLEHLRDIFETEQVSSCLLCQLSAIGLFTAHIVLCSELCVLYSILWLKCSTICPMLNLFVSGMFLPCLLAACDVSREAREPRTLCLSPKLPDSWESYSFSLWAVLLSALSWSFRPWEARG